MKVLIAKAQEKYQGQWIVELHKEGGEFFFKEYQTIGDDYDSDNVFNNYKNFTTKASPGNNYSIWLKKQFDPYTRIRNEDMI